MKELREYNFKSEILEDKWSTYKLRDIIKFSKKGKIPDYVNGIEGNILLGIEYLENKGLVKYVSNKSDTQRNDILILWDGSQAGKVFTNYEGVLGSTFVSISLEDAFDSNYVYQYLRKHLNTIQTNWREGSGIPHVSKDFFDYFQILIPDNIKEQQKISEILSIVDDQIEQTGQLIEKTKYLKNGLMQQLLTKGTGHTEFKQTDVGEIPVDWEYNYIDNFAERQSGHTPNKQTSSYWNGTIPWISLADLSRLDKRFISETTTYTTKEGIDNSSAVLLPKGTVVISRDATVGKIGITGQQMATSQHFINYICSRTLDNIYLYYYLSFQKKSFERFATGSTIKTIGLGYFKKLKILVPPLEEQQKIANILSSVDEKIAVYEKEKATYEKLRKGLMQQLLTGRTRVTI